MIRILVGDCRQRLKEIVSESVQLCVTSPPYYALRDYGADSQLGLEPTPEEYIDNLVGVFGEVQRTLKDTGVLVLNLGDSYANDTKWGGSSGGKNYTSAAGNYQGQRAKRDTGLKPKDLMGIPWRVALALQADGWYLRSAMPWAKANAMPESCKDRPTTAHEYVFLLAKSSKYFWDAEAIRQEHTDVSLKRWEFEQRRTSDNGWKSQNRAGGMKANEVKLNPSGRNYRTSDLFNASLDLAIEQQRAYLAHLEHVRDNGGLMLDENGDPVALMVNTAGFSGAHFAVFPPALVEPFVKAGTNERGECPACGAAWERVVERKPSTPGRAQGYTRDTGMRNDGERAGHWIDAQTLTTGWQPTCTCNAGDPIPQTVLDPFGGAGTTALVADRLQRHAILCELNPDYAEMARGRLVTDGGMFTQVEVT